MSDDRLRIPYQEPTFADARAAIAARERQREERAREPGYQQMLAAARAEAAAAARRLREDFGATRVRLFGSLARGDADPGFDIDLAVEGIPGERFFAAWAAAELAARRRVDLVDLAAAPPLLRQRVEEDGIDLP